MEKSELMKRYEAETGKQSAIVKFMCGGQALEQKSYPKLGPYDYSMDYIAWLEAKAAAYDRLMSGGKKTLKEWANIFGKPIVVDSDDTILVFSSVPRYDCGYSQEGEFIDDWIGEVIAHIDCEYEGEYVDDVTLPDGWEATGE